MMKLFNLPDLGEGLPDAEIHEWFVKEGDKVDADQILVSMETAKAVVDVPSPYAGVIKKLHGKQGDIIKTGSPLVEFESESADQGTVVGKLEESHEVGEDQFTIGSQTNTRTQATPAIQLLAKKLKIDLKTLKGTGEHGLITKQDVLNASEKIQQTLKDYEPLRGTRRAMLASMQQSHQEIVPVSIFDVANLSSWSKDTDITIRIIRAIQSAIKTEPHLNAWYNNDHQSRRCFNELNLGLAMDSDEGLFVPVLQDVQNKTDSQLRIEINQFKEEVRSRRISSEKLKGASITLSNFGKFAGRFASPIIVPPQVAILAVGKIYREACEVNEQVIFQNMLPLSLSFDHRAITGGEATRFLGAVITALMADALHE